jgi:hypothetical protein
MNVVQQYGIKWPEIYFVVASLKMKVVHHLQLIACIEYIIEKN